MEEANMTLREAPQEQSGLGLPIDRLALTLRTARALKQHDIRTIEQLVGTTESDLAAAGLSMESRIEIREVLASRGM
jgi:DNA-directed RNA polymerase alpha subunit